MRQPLAVEAALPPADLPDPVETALRNADLGALWAAIRDLPVQQREALLKRELFGLSYGELAQALAVSESAVESLLVRARRQLRLRLRPAVAASLAPLLALRDALARVASLGHTPSGAERLASLPLAAKLAAGAAAVGVVAGGVVVADPRLPGGAESARLRPAAIAPSLLEPDLPFAATAPGLRKEGRGHAGRQAMVDRRLVRRRPDASLSTQRASLSRAETTERVSVVVGERDRGRKGSAVGIQATESELGAKVWPKGRSRPEGAWSPFPVFPAGGAMAPFPFDDEGRPSSESGQVGPRERGRGQAGSDPGDDDRSLAREEGKEAERSGRTGLSRGGAELALDDTSNEDGRGGGLSDRSGEETKAEGLPESGLSGELAVASSEESSSGGGSSSGSGWVSTSHSGSGSG